MKRFPLARLVLLSLAGCSSILGPEYERRLAVISGPSGDTVTVERTVAVR